MILLTCIKAYLIFAPLVAVCAVLFIRGATNQSGYVRRNTTLEEV